MNKVFLIGNLTKKPEVREVKSSKICDFTVAINRQNDGVDYIECIAWNKTAELIGTYLDKGSKVSVEGRLAVDSYEDKDGNKRKNTSVMVESIEFLSPKKESKEQEVLMQAKTESQIGTQIQIDEEDYPW